MCGAATLGPVKKQPVVLRCSFCGKDQAVVPKLIAGPNGSYICTECVALCVEIHAEDGIELRNANGGEPQGPPPERPVMGRIDASWRGEYITAATSAERAAGAADPATVAGCVFCRILASGAEDPDIHVLSRGEHVFAILNAYPYTSGHLMCMPYRHVGDLTELTAEEQVELWDFVRQATAACTRAYQPEGLNVGANLGRAAGAGVPGHLHVHVVPRWHGDTNFMTAIAETRVVPESLAVSWDRLTKAWDR